MNRTLLPIRLVFIALCAAAAWLLCYAIADWDDHRALAIAIGTLIGVLVVLVDILLKGFSLRGLSAITFGLIIGSAVSYLIGRSPLLEEGDPQIIYLVRLTLFLVLTYLCTVIALRGKDEFNLVIPYVRFVPHEVDVPLVVIDASAVIDGRIVRVCEAGFLGSAVVLPRFVLDEIQRTADSADPVRQARGRRGLEVINQLRKIPRLDLRIHESEVAKQNDSDAKLVFLAQSMKAKLLTTNYNLAKMAEFAGVPWLNLNALSQALRPALTVGEVLEVELVKPGKEDGQAVGYLEDGTMVVVGDARDRIGARVQAEITSVIPSAAGKIVFSRVAEAA